ncbi:MAG TPA: hypothetical protein VF221_20300 [Chloroflexota bacterium]
MTRLSRSTRAPATFVLLVYGVWLLAMWSSGHDARDFIHMGRRYAFAPHAVSLFTPDPRYRYATRTNGYDGQFAYYIAVNPVGARLHLDRVNYRYTRIVYPMTARLLSFGDRALIPYALIAINWLAIGAGTYVISLWLRRRGVSPWLALVYGLSPGLFVCLQRDLEEPLAYALVALALLVYSSVERRRTLASGIIFAVAMLTRESIVVFPLVLAASSFFTQHSSDAFLSRRRTAALLLVPAFLPFLLYKAFLLAWLSPDTAAVPPGLLPRIIPFSGLLSYWPWRNHQVEVIIGVVVPSLVWAGMGVWAVGKRHASPEVWFLLANVLVFVVMLNRLSYENIYATSRIATGVVLAMLLSISTFDRLTGGSRLWLSLSALLWFLPWPILVSFVEQVPLTRALLLETIAALCLWALAERSLHMGEARTSRSRG